MKAEPIEIYIQKNYESQVAYAKAKKVHPQQVTQWIRKGYVIIDGKRYSPREK